MGAHDMDDVASDASVPRVPLFLAPMEGVTDLAYRLLAREAGADHTVTEFTSSEGLSRGAERSWAKVRTDARESPFIAQIFGGDEAAMVATAVALSESADVIDLNFGCPAPKVCAGAAGAALLADPDRLVGLVAAVMAATPRPVSVKLRLGTSDARRTALEIATRLDALGVLRLAVHGRTLVQRYRGVADWQAIADIASAVDMPVIANGDIVDAASARACLAQTGAAGLMIGRAAIGDPLVFARIAAGLGWDAPVGPWSDDQRPDDGPTARRIHGARWALLRYVELAHEVVDDQDRALFGGDGIGMTRLIRHAQAFTKGLPGGRRLRHDLHSGPRTVTAVVDTVIAALDAGLERLRSGAPSVPSTA